MRRFYVKTIIEAPSEEDAIALRDEIVGAVEDAKERRYPGEASVGELIEIETDRDEAIKELARERHCYGSDNEVEVDDEHVIVSEGEDGAWVAGWLFVPNRLLDERGLLEAEDDDSQDEGFVETCESEGGHCD